MTDYDRPIGAIHLDAPENHREWHHLRPPLVTKSLLACIYVPLFPTPWHSAVCPSSRPPSTPVSAPLSVKLPRRPCVLRPKTPLRLSADRDPCSMSMTHCRPADPASPTTQDIQSETTHLTDTTQRNTQSMRKFGLSSGWCQ